MPMLVRNTGAGPTVFSDIANHISIEWQGADDPNGNDVQYAPEALVENVNFIKAVQRGILVVEESTPEIQKNLQRQVDAYHQGQQMRARRTESVMDRNVETPIKTVVISETGQIIDGKPEETQVPVVMEQRQKVAE